MSRATCPSCGFGFENRRRERIEELRGRMILGPERPVVAAQAKAADFDTCPRCANRFLSKDFAFFGEFTRAKLRGMARVYGVVGGLACAFLAAAWMSGD